MKNPFDCLEKKGTSSWKYKIIRAFK